MIKTELYFGRQTPDSWRHGVADQQWQDFEINEIASRFDGFTVLDGRGYWKGQSEKCKVVVFVHVDTGDTRARIDDIQEEYRKRFGQEEILRVDTKVKVSF